MGGNPTARGPNVGWVAAVAAEPRLASGGSTSRGTGARRIDGSHACRVLGAPVETDPMRMCALLVGLPDVDVLAVDDLPDAPIVIVVESRLDAVWCGQCGVRARVKDRPTVELVDLP